MKSHVQRGTEGTHVPPCAEKLDSPEPKTPGKQENIIRGIGARLVFSRGRGVPRTPVTPLNTASAIS